MSQTVLAVEDLEVTFRSKSGPLRAISNVSFAVDQGEVIGIVGESGCGKSVTALATMGLIGPMGTVSRGRILFRGKDIVPLPKGVRENLRGHRMAMIFQEPMTALNPILTIGAQIDEQLRRHLKLSPADARTRSMEWIRRVGIPSPQQRYHEYPHQLSGGMRQRAMIAMALSCEPDLLIADEPTTALDVTIQSQILDLIQEMQESRKMAVQFITHDLGVISEFADKIVVMYAGRICEVADNFSLFKHPCHPYTNGLLASRPRRGVKERRLTAIPGTVPTLMEMPRGCAFQNRCPRASARCRAESPTLAQISATQSVACFHPVAT